jgi:hypothetical protein
MERMPITVPQFLHPDLPNMLRTMSVGPACVVHILLK